ncbi:MAG: type VI secretion system tube protein Hcp [Acetobacteraceae bacterium]|nr:type VI secretion system tube protein Hcp [Acetobacteraceae bacterium]
MPIYMKYGDIKGDVTEAGHKDWIALHSFQWGVGRGISSPTGAAHNREASAPSISEVVVTKNQDVSSVQLLEEAYQGQGKDVEIHFTRTMKDKLDTYMQYKLTNTMVSGYSISSGGDRPTESISLNFTKVEYKMTPQSEGGKNVAGSSVTYNLAEAKTA